MRGCLDGGAATQTAQATTDSSQVHQKEFKRGAVELVRTTGRPIAYIARDLGVYDFTLATGCAKRPSTAASAGLTFRRGRLSIGPRRGLVLRSSIWL
jgi:hypothetical protein